MVMHWMQSLVVSSDWSFLSRQGWHRREKDLSKLEIQMGGKKKEKGSCML